jgi:hypothetical protein
MDYDPSGAAVGALVALFVALYVGFILVIAVGAYVLGAIGWMQLFKKVGIEPWIAWVPFYNTWKVLELGSQPGWIAVLSVVPGGSIVAVVFLALAEHRIGISFGKDAGWVVLAIFVPWLWAILLGRQQEVYDPRRLAAFGYPPPHAGYFSVPPTSAF